MNLENSQAKIFASIHASTFIHESTNVKTLWTRNWLIKVGLCCFDNQLLVSSSHALVVILIQLVTHITTLLLSELHASCLAKAKQADIACTFCHNIWTTKLMTMAATISLETGKTEGTNVFPPSLHEQWTISLLKHDWSQTFLIFNQKLNLLHRPRLMSCLAAKKKTQLCITDKWDL